MFTFWLILFISFTILEICNPGLFFFLSLAASALLLSGLQWYQPTDINTQFFIFFVSSAILFFLLKKLVDKAQHKSRTTYVPHMQDLIGKTAQIVEVMSSNTGYVHIDGTTWLIVTPQHHSLTKNCTILITGIKGNHLLATLSTYPNKD